MLFTNYIKEDSEELNDVELLTGVESGSDAEVDAAAIEVSTLIDESALASMTYFEGGEEAQKAFIESSEVQALVEARKMSKKTFVRLGKTDDFTRRAHLASLILARNAKDPLFNKLALNRVNERRLRSAIFKKYESKAKLIAKKSQAQHIKNMKKMPALPKIRFN